MGRSLNKVMVIGHLGRDPEMRYTPNGQSVTNFSVAASRRWKNSEGEQQEETEWFNIEAWGKTGELANEYLKKGSLVYVEGRLRTHSWEDPNTHEKKYRTNVVALDVRFLDSRSSQGGGGEDFGSSPSTGDPGFDDMPF